MYSDRVNRLTEAPVTNSCFVETYNRDELDEDDVHVEHGGQLRPRDSECLARFTSVTGLPAVFGASIISGVSPQTVAALKTCAG